MLFKTPIIKQSSTATKGIVLDKSKSKLTLGEKHSFRVCRHILPKNEWELWSKREGKKEAGEDVRANSSNEVNSCFRAPWIRLKI